MLISRLPAGGAGGELHGANIIVATEEADLIGKTVDLYFGDIIVKSGVFNSEGVCTFKGLQEVGEYEVRCEDLRGVTAITVDDIFNKNTLEIDLIRYVELVLGETYSLAGYDWTCAEEIEGGYVLQCQDVVATGNWAGYIKSGRTATQSIIGEDISPYYSLTQTLYENIKSAEKTEALFGNGLYLLNLAKLNFVQTGQDAAKNARGSCSGYYADAMNIALTKAEKYSYIMLGNVANPYAGQEYSYYVRLKSYIDAYYQTGNHSVVPAFNIDSGKIILNDHTILIR